MKCKHCGSTYLWSRGRIVQRILGITTKIKRYQCQGCGRFIQSEPKASRSAKILLLDIETIPGEYYAFDPKVEYLSPDKQIKPWSISCWAAKWLFSPEIMGQVVSGKDAFNREDHEILTEVWNLLDEADVVVTQNGVNFDIKKINTKFIKYGFPPPSQYLNVDTLKVAKETFSFDYNRLDELGRELGIGSKKEMFFYDWRKCAEGDDEYLKKTLEYCKNDVAPLLEDVYLTMLPWMKKHPNLGLYSDNDRDICPRCESPELHWGGKDYPTPMGLWEGWRCDSCGSTGRGHGKDHKLKSVYVSSVVPS